MLRLYHNRRCSKSRECLQLIMNSSIEYKVINYLEDNIGPNDLEALIKGLINPVEDLIRINEKSIKNIKINFCNKKDLINIIMKYKICMQRPIVALGDVYEICRPVNKVLKYLGKAW